MSDAHSSWLKSALGVDVHETLKKIERKANDASSAVRDAASKTLDGANTAGKAIVDAQAAAWEGTKKAYTATTGAYDKIAPNFNESNKSLGKLVDAAEAAAKKGNEKAAAKVAKVPVVGKVAKVTTAVANASIDAVGGVVKGAGDLTAMAGQAVVHPIDAAGSLAEGALGIAEHGPMMPGVNTTFRAAHGIVDLARGKKDGEYGSNLKELGENLAMGTHQDPKTHKRTNADLDFVAGMGGGKDAWSEKPAEAATRTIVNVAPMFMGDEAAQGNKGTPKGGTPVPEGAVDPLGKTQVDPLGKTQDMSKTHDLGKTQPDIGDTQPGGPTDAPSPKEVDPPKGGPEPDAPKGKVDPIRQRVVDAAAAEKVARDANLKATQDFVRYQQKMPDPSRGYAGDGWDPKVSRELDAKAHAAEQDWIKANDELKAAQKEAKAAQDAASREKGKRGGGGFPPPRKK